jgi:MFS transporter, DHA3 family, macrolide efflux protein
LPIFIFSFIGGAYADRWQPKKTMIWCDLLSAASVFVVIGALIFGSWQVIFFAMLVSSTLSQFSQPSGLKLFKIHLEERLIQQGMAVYQTIYAVFMIFGPVIGTFAYQRLGIDLSITITGVAFLLSAAALSFIPRDEKVKKAENATNIFQEMKSGVRYVLAKKELKLLGCGFLTAGLGVGLIQPMNIFSCNRSPRPAERIPPVARNGKRDRHDCRRRVFNVFFEIRLPA